MCSRSIPNNSYWALALERKRAHTEKEKKPYYGKAHTTERGSKIKCAQFYFKL